MLDQTRTVVLHVLKTRANAITMKIREFETERKAVIDAIQDIEAPEEKIEETT